MFAFIRTDKSFVQVVYDKKFQPVISFGSDVHVLGSQSEADTFAFRFQEFLKECKLVRIRIEDV